MALIFAILGGLISRWHGGGFVSGSPKVLKNILWALPIAALCYSVHDGSLIAFFLVLVSCLAGKSLGHGRGFRLKEPMKPGSSPERVEILIPKKLPLYWYKVSIMSLTGLAAVSGAVIAISIINPIAGLIVALGGAFKGVNAMVFDLKTEYREFADGFAAYFCLAVAYMMVSNG